MSDYDKAVKDHMTAARRLGEVRPSHSQVSPLTLPAQVMMVSPPTFASAASIVTL